jgi:hypothetical protein
VIDRVECPTCGQLVDPRGLYRHQKAKGCRTVLSERRMAERGWKRCGDVAALLRRVGADTRRELGFVHDGVAQENGRPRRRSRQVLWAPAHVVDAARYATSTEKLQELLDADDPVGECERFATMHCLARSPKRRGSRSYGASA